MAIPITIPRLGWSMEEGTFLGWLKRDGESVQAGEPLYTLESDKAVQEIEATDNGIVRIAPDGPKENETIAVGTILGYLAAPGEDVNQFRAEVKKKTESRRDVKPRRLAPASPSVRRLARESGIDLAQVQGSGQGGRIIETDVRAFRSGVAKRTTWLDPVRSDRIHAVPGSRAISPRARRAAAKLGVEWSQVQGTGRTGRIRERDILDHAARKQARGPSTNLRRTIAERLAHSFHTSVPVTLTTTADATNLIKLRDQIKAGARTPKGLVPTYTDFIVKFIAVALQSHPALNARWEDDGVVELPDIHIGIAVDTEAGLLVPVIRNVPSLTLQKLSLRSRELIAKAHTRKLTVDELQGGTFTVSNLGAFGIDAFTPIINWPEAAVLGVGRIHQQPAVVDNQVVPRDLVTLSLTFDHRIVDGAPAARFLDAIRQYIENPDHAL